MRISIIVLLLFSLVGCEKWQVILDNTVPKCINEKIEEFEKEMDALCEKGAKVTQFKFQDDTVYLFSPSNCLADFGSEVLNQKCEVICTLGTILGITECRGESFGTAEEIKVIWEQ